MNDYEVNKYREAFNLFDKDKSGKISIEELSEILKTFGYSTDNDDMKTRLKEIDDDGNGVIDFDEFLKVITIGDDLLNQFRMFDLNNDGYITFNELFTVMKKLGIPFSENQVKDMINSVDRDGDGRINYNEFVALNKYFTKS